MPPKKRKIVIDVATAEAPTGYHYWGQEPKLFCGKVTKPLRPDIEGTQSEIYRDFFFKVESCEGDKLTVHYLCCFEGCPHG